MSEDKTGMIADRLTLLRGGEVDFQEVSRGQMVGGRLWGKELSFPGQLQQ